MVRADEGASLAETLNRLFDATQRLVRENIRLARSELQREVGALGRRTAWLLVAGALLLLGAGLLNASVAVALAPWLGVAGSLGALALLNLLAGGALLAWRFGKDKAAAQLRPSTEVIPIETSGCGNDGAAA